MNPHSRRGTWLAALVIVALSGWPGEGLATGPSITFSVKVISTQDPALEPTISYAPNGTVWFSGMVSHAGGADGNLWYAQNDTSSFVKETDPPTYGSADATVHHDAAGRLFWAEIEPGGNDHNTSVGVRTSGTWTTQNFTNGDRPWFRTNSTGKTFLALKNQVSEKIALWIHTPNGVADWAPWADVFSPGALGDFVNHTDDTLYLLIWNATSRQYVVAYLPPASIGGWQFTPEFAAPEVYGIPRLVVDLSGNLFVVTAENRSSEYGVWLRHFSGSTWSAAKRLSETGTSGGYPSSVAGVSGRVGAAWYEADGSFAPENAPSTTVWRLKYGLFEGATGTISPVERAMVANRTHVGPLLDVHVGEFTYIVRRAGDSAGRVAIGFSCDSGDATLGCPSGLSGPVFAVQTAGPGLL